jgi:oligoribonuclease NrnB/cAMP/cGMP phosphodiesterase (DHH superfamily)
MKKRLVIYHDRCVDGFTAAWAIWCRFGDHDTEYLPANHGDAAPSVRGRDVYIVDFSYPREVLIDMHREARELLVLDHHRTARVELEGLSYALFDMERSGAGMTWDYFHGADTRPWLIDYVEDRDLWRFKLSGSKQVNAWIGAQTRTRFLDWTWLLQEGMAKASEQGAAVLRYVDRYVEEMSVQAREVYTEHSPQPVPVINAPYINISELLQHLAKDKPFAVGWFERNDGVFQYSLRSSATSDVDVSEVAKKYGGGGHKNAAGFTSAAKLW